MARDISVTGMINMIFKDNRAVCAQVSDSTIRHFVGLAADQLQDSSIGHVLERPAVAVILNEVL